MRSALRDYSSSLSIAALLILGQALRLPDFGRADISTRDHYVKKPPLKGAVNLNKLAATYSHMAYRHTTIGATMFHFRVRNGTGWFHCAMATRILTSNNLRSEL